MDPRPRTRPRSAWALPLLVFALLSGCDRGRETARSLLLVSVDTLRVDHVSCYGYPRATTPRLDELAARGHRFDAAWTVMATTLPAHASLLSSLYPRQTGSLSNGMRVAPAVKTLAERLRERGFATGAFVSAVPLHPDFGLAQGFDAYDAPPGEERSGDLTRERAVAWLRGHAAQPFFCFVHLFDPHTWYTAPAPQRRLFEVPEGRYPPASGFVDAADGFGPEARVRSIAAYDAEIRFADEQLGLLLDELEALGVASSTLVVFVSDHGETLDEAIDTHAYAFDHGEFLHPRELRVPLVVHVPDGLPGAGARVHPRPVSLLDVTPTLLELLGAPLEPPLVGRSLVPLLEGGSIAERPVFSERRILTREELLRPPSPLVAPHELAVATAEWSLVRREERASELYELASRVGAARDVAADHPDTVQRLEGLLDAWLDAYRVARAAGEGPVDPALLEALRALGYATDEPR